MILNGYSAVANHNKLLKTNELDSIGFVQFLTHNKTGRLFTTQFTMFCTHTRQQSSTRLSIMN